MSRHPGPRLLVPFFVLLFLAASAAQAWEFVYGPPTTATPSPRTPS